MIGKGSHIGRFLFKLAWQVARRNRQIQPMMELGWNSITTPRIQMLPWRLLTKTRFLEKKGV